VTDADILRHAAKTLVEHPLRRVRDSERNRINESYEVQFGRGVMRRVSRRFWTIFDSWNGHRWQDNEHQAIALCLAASIFEYAQSTQREG
jgi:hypothetical protein